PVAQKLKALVIADGLDRTGVGQGRFEQAQIFESIPGPRGNGAREGFAFRPFQGHCRCPYSTQLNSRDGRISDGHFQISRGLAPPAIEKKMMLARPTRFSSGTNPTEKRLSVELSLLSPIMK